MKTYRYHNKKHTHLMFSLPDFKRVFTDVKKTVTTEGEMDIFQRLVNGLSEVEWHMKRLKRRKPNA